MSDLSGLLAVGIAIGGLYTIMGLTIVLIYRATNLVNFAHGEFAGLGVFAFLQATIIGQLPIFAGVAVGLCLAASLSLLFGSVSEKMRLRGGPLVPLISSFGLLIAANGFAITRWASNQPYRLPSISGAGDILMGGVAVAADYAAALSIAVLLGILLAITFRKTPLGLMLRATVANPTMSALLGINTRRLRLGVWALAGALGYIAMHVFTALQLLDTGRPEILLLKGFASASVGGFGSFGAVVVGGLSLGAIEAILGRFMGSALREVLAVGIVVSMLFLFPRGLFAARFERQ